MRCLRLFPCQEALVENNPDNIINAAPRNDELRDTFKLGNSRTYRFTLGFRMNSWAITLIVLGLATAVGVAATIVMKRKRLFKK